MRKISSCHSLLLYSMAPFPLSVPLISQINYFDRFCRVRNVYYIYIYTECRHSLGEDPEIQWERRCVCEKDEKTKKKTKAETAWFLLASQECYPFFSQGTLMYSSTAKRNTAYSITTIKTSVFSFILTNDCADLCWIKDAFQLISHWPAQADRVMEPIGSMASPHILMVTLWRITFLNCTDISNASVEKSPGTL